jgi:hypothetical protein
LLTFTVNFGITYPTSYFLLQLSKVAKPSGNGGLDSNKPSNIFAIQSPDKSFSSILTSASHLISTQMPLTINLVLSSARMSGLLHSTLVNLTPPNATTQPWKKNCCLLLKPHNSTATSFLVTLANSYVIIRA